MTRTSKLDPIALHNRVLRRFGEVSAGRYAELMVAKLLDGEIVNKTGHDILTPLGWKIEVKSRVNGTDSENPRVTLGPTNIREATHVVAVRFTRGYSIHAVKLLPMSAVEPLYQARKQAKGTAHIPFNDFFNHPEAECLLSRTHSLLTGRRLRG